MSSNAMVLKPNHVKATRERKKLTETRFARNYGLLSISIALLFTWTVVVWLTAYRCGVIKTTDQLTIEYDHEYALKMSAYEEAWIVAHTPSADEEAEALLYSEADCIARAIGPMKTKQMKQTMIWNILARVDSPYYPDTVDEVVNQKDQWMFYSADNPIRDDDVVLALEQLQAWHAGRYPARFDNSLVYGKWSTNDYVLFDDWSQGMGTKTWRFGE